MAACEQLHRLVDLDVRREHEDPCGGEVLPDDTSGVEPLGRVRGWHADVDDDELRLLFTDQGEQLRPVAGLADDVEAVSLEQAGDPLAEQDVVVRQRYARGAFIHRVTPCVADLVAIVMIIGHAPSGLSRRHGTALAPTTRIGIPSAGRARPTR